MKKISLFFLFAVLTFSVLGQDEDVANNPEIKDPAMKEKMQAARIAYITERLGLTPQEAEKFWPLYKEYILRQRGLKQQYKGLQESGKPASELLDLEHTYKQQGLNLEKEYSLKLRQTISPQKLMNLKRAEEDFRKLVLQQLQQRQLNQQRRELQRDRIQQKQQQRNN